MNTSRKLMIPLFIALIAVVVGCAEEPEVITTETAAVDRTTATETGQEVPSMPDGSEPVQVVLTGFEIRMPESIPEGVTLFTVRNEGDMEHSFEIEGQGMEKELEQHLQPGEVTTIEVDLMPGEYRVYCPVDDHADRGMEMTFTVTPAAGTTTTTDTEMPTDTGI